MRFARAKYVVVTLSLAGGCSLDVSGLPGPGCDDPHADGCSTDVANLPMAGCGNQVLDPGEACDDSSAFCVQCQLVCPAGWVKSSTTATCYGVLPPPLRPGELDWARTKSWDGARMACAAEAPSRLYDARLAGPGVVPELPKLTACPQTMEDGKGGCWFGARCPNDKTCANGDVMLDWSDRSSQASLSGAWSNGNPSGDGNCVEYIPHEGVNDDRCDKAEHYLCEVTPVSP